MERLRFVRLRDEITWWQFGAPDPGFFDNWIKDRVLEVVAQTNCWVTIQDPCDVTVEFLILREYVYSLKMNKAEYRPAV